MSFDEIVGQNIPKKILLQSIRNNKLGQAYIFYGPEGVGKEMFAIRLACQLNCENLQNGQFCRKCNSCLKILNNNHPDVIWIFPIPTSSKLADINDFCKQKLEKPYESLDVKSNLVISIDTVRELKSRMKYKPYEGEKRVIILVDCDMMTNEAANAFLKSLEEPPEQTFIFLTTARINSILPTISSRCQKVKFQRISEENMLNYLKRKYKDYPVDELKLITKISDGNLAKAILMTENKDFTIRNNVIKLLEIISSQNKIELLRNLNNFDKRSNKENVIQMLNTLQLFVKDMIMINNKSSDLVVNIDQTELMKKLILLNFDLVKFVNEIEKTKIHINSNVNVKNSLWLLLIKMWGM